MNTTTTARLPTIFSHIFLCLRTCRNRFTSSFNDSFTHAPRFPGFSSVFLFYPIYSATAFTPACKVFFHYAAPCVASYSAISGSLVSGRIPKRDSGQRRSRSFPTICSSETQPTASFLLSTDMER